MEIERGQFGTVIKDVGDIDNDGFHGKIFFQISIL